MKSDSLDQTDRPSLLAKIQKLEEQNKTQEKIISSLKAEFGSLVLSNKYFFDIMGPIIEGFVKQGFNIPKLMDQLKKTLAAIKASPGRFEQVAQEYLPNIKSIIGKYAKAFEMEAARSAS